ncbi:hypothetical protein BR93DRAFT_379462 [Coniochaeta sp. PMI_546]|nr:hypothetical protein BR93DRAFT_379462 [Coniochaeta sp. PMI_546]
MKKKNFVLLSVVAVKVPTWYRGASATSGQSMLFLWRPLHLDHLMSSAKTEVYSHFSSLSLQCETRPAANFMQSTFHIRACFLLHLPTCFAPQTSWIGFSRLGVEEFAWLKAVPTAKPKLLVRNPA